MTEVVIARFTNPDDADLAMRFLGKHGIKARAPAWPQSRSIGSSATGLVGETPLFVGKAQAGRAAELLKRVLAGEFAEKDSSSNSRSGLGAALSEALLPAADFKAPSRLAILAPFLCLAGLLLGSLAVSMLIYLFRSSLG